MHEIRVDIEKNRLYFTLGSIEDKSEMDLITAKTKAAAEQLQAGFSCVSDLRYYSVPYDLGDEFIRECQIILWDTSIGKVVRVSDFQKSTGHFKFEMGSIVWPAYHVEVADTIEQAEILLDQLVLN